MSALGPTKSLLDWVSESLAEVMQPEREADQSPSCSAEVKNESGYICTSINLGVGIAQSV
jgi:hypothetical protein